MRQGYYAVVPADRQLGRLPDARVAGAANQTVVAYTTDHGEMLGKFGLGGNTAVRRCGIPLVVAGPGFARARVKTPVSLLDFQAPFSRPGRAACRLARRRCSIFRRRMRSGSCS